MSQSIKTAGVQTPDQRCGPDLSADHESAPAFPIVTVADEIVRLVRCASALLNRGTVDAGDPLPLPMRAEAACELLDKIGWLADLASGAHGGSPWAGVNFEDWACGAWDGAAQAGMLDARLRYLRSVLPASGGVQ